MMVIIWLIAERATLIDKAIIAINMFASPPHLSEINNQVTCRKSYPHFHIKYYILWITIVFIIF